MTKCPKYVVGLATALAVATASACAGPEGSIGPQGGTPAPPNVAPSLVVTNLSGYAIHNRVPTESTQSEGSLPGRTPPTHAAPAAKSARNGS